ncbi:MAG: metal-dependent protease of the PAD1/JAB1 superfamily [Methanosarcinales archaeon]|nr:metal-dependent protease of the PAD1/JAB1 superfamily [Methanosarcinales archaeon]
MRAKEIRGIARETLEFILEVSKSTAPNEFAGLLRAEDGIITEVVVLPGTESSEVSAVMHIYMLPMISVAGSVHSHPTPNTRPSQHDLSLFTRTGNCHIIAGFPYNEHSWTCYDAYGARRKLPVLDVEFGDV